MNLSGFRLERLSAAADAAGYDVVVSSLPQNSRYIGGYQSVGQDVLHRTQAYTMFVPSTGRVAYIVGFSELPSVVEAAGEDAEIICFGASFRFEGVEGYSLTRIMERCKGAAHPSPEEALAAAIRSTGKTKVALDESRISAPSWDKVAKALPGVALAPGTGVFMEARRIKHPDEIAGIERAAEVAEDSLAKALAGFKPGMTELALQELYRQEVVRQGADPYFYVGTAARRAAYSDTVNTGLMIQPGDMIRFDFGCILEGYCSDLARTASVGHPDSKLKAYYEAIRLGTSKAIAAMKPGVSAEEIFRVAQDETAKGGIPHYQRHHCGHGIGLETYDLLSIAPGETRKLEENMTYCIETPYYELGWGGAQIENTVVVEQGGARYLDKTGDALIILDA